MSEQERTERETNEKIAAWMNDGFTVNDEGRDEHLCLSAIVNGCFQSRKLFTRSLDSMALAEARLTTDDLKEDYGDKLYDAVCKISGTIHWREGQWWQAAACLPPSIRAAALCEVVKETP